MKIVLIGPVYPFKGGIAHYTSLLCKALRSRHDVCMVSYKMQYPKLLFKKEQRDYSNKSFQVEDTRFWINTANPLNAIRTAHKIKKMKPGAVIIQWWHPYFAPYYYILMKCLGRIPIIMTCHNVFPHERFPFDHFLTRLVLRQANGYVVQSHLDEQDLCMINSEANYVVTPHPTYNAFKMKNMSKEEARGILKINDRKPVILFFGFVREYKGLNYLLDALVKVKEQIPEIQLLVVGEFGADKEKYLNQIQKNQLKQNICMVEGYVPDEEIEKYFVASDLVVLPYISATQSGIVQIAYGFEKPVVVTDVGGLPDVVWDRETGYIIPSENADKIAEAIIAFYMQDKDIDWQANIRTRAELFSWEMMTKQIEKLIDQQLKDFLM